MDFALGADILHLSTDWSISNSFDNKYKNFSQNWNQERNWKNIIGKRVFVCQSNISMFFQFKLNFGQFHLCFRLFKQKKIRFWVFIYLNSVFSSDAFQNWEGNVCLVAQTKGRFRCNMGEVGLYTLESYSL